MGNVTSCGRCSVVTESKTCFWGGRVTTDPSLHSVYDKIRRNLDEDIANKIKDEIWNEEKLLKLKQEDLEPFVEKVRDRIKVWNILEKEMDKRISERVKRFGYTLESTLESAAETKFGHETNGATIYFCERHQDKKKFAAKRIDWSRCENPTEDITDIISRFDQDNKVVLYYGFCEIAKYKFVFMQLCGGDVDQLIKFKRNEKDQKDIIPIDQLKGTFLEQKEEINFLVHFGMKDDFDNKIKDVMFQVVEAVEYLHTYKPPIVHGDIKPSNFLLYKLNSGKTVVKIADFSLNRIAPDEKTRKVADEDSIYSFLSPEYLNGEHMDAKPITAPDIFSLGLTLFYIFTEGFHVYGKDPEEHLMSIKDKKTPNISQALKEESQQTDTGTNYITQEHRITFCDMIRRMLNFDPKKRFTIQDVTKHPTFWDSRKKVQFYKGIFMELEPWKLDNEARSEQKWKTKELDQHNAYLTGGEDGMQQSFVITSEVFPKVCTATKTYPIRFRPEEPNVHQLVNAIRNKSSHKLTPEEHKELGLDQDDWDKFLDEFTRTVPQLLVHLYEEFRYAHSPNNDEYWEGKPRMRGTV